jgi:hypothetical protein
VERPLNDRDLSDIEARSDAATPGPWQSSVEGRDHWGGDNFIQIQSSESAPDLYVEYGSVAGLTPASIADQDFIAASRQDVPRLIKEVRRLQKLLGPEPPIDGVD